MQPGFGWRQEVVGNEPREPGVCEVTSGSGGLVEEHG